LPDCCTTICFDLDDTLIDRRRGLLAFHRSLLNPPVSEAEWLAMHEDGALPRFGRGRIFHDLESGLPIPSSSLQKRVIDTIVRSIVPDRELAGLLLALSTEFHLMILSNGHAGVQRRKLKAAGLDRIFSPDSIVISGACGFAKPDPRIFTHCAAVAQERPGNMVMVGDSPGNDIEGARAAGFPAIWISRGRRWPLTSPCPDAVLHSLVEAG
jgi:putative hydrolase of the HAD superfamily